MKTFTISRVHAKALLPAVLVAAVTESTFAERPTSTMVFGQFSEMDEAMTPRVRPTAEEQQETRAYFTPATEWTRTMDKRFRELVKKDALGTIAREESSELERMSQERRNLQFSRTADEVLWEAKQREVTGNLVKALKTYVEFHKAPHRPRAST